MKRALLAILIGLAPAAAVCAQNQKGALRLIVVASEAEAVRIRDQIRAGQSFEELAKKYSVDPSSAQGGYLGTLSVEDLRPDFKRGLEGVKPGDVSQVIRLGVQFALLQMAPEPEGDAAWSAQDDAASQALQEGRLPEAARLFQAAIKEAEKFGSEDYRVAQSLTGLAETYRLQKKYTDAEPLHRRALAILERTFGPEDRNVAGSLINLGALLADESKYAEAEPLLKRALEIRWKAPIDVLDNLTTVLTLTYFRDAQFNEALRKYRDAVRRAALSEDLSIALTHLLFSAELPEEAEAVIQRALQAFPDSRRVRFELADLYRNEGKMKAAAEAFETASRMKAPPDMDPELDRLQRSFIYMRLGGIYTDLVLFDAAEKSYQNAINVTPNSIEARLLLGNVYIQDNKTDEAMAEFTRAVSTNPQSAPAQFSLADLFLRVGRFPEAVAAAAKALEIDPNHRRAHYVRAMALVRLDQQDEAQKDLQEYRKLETAAEAETNGLKDVSVINWGAGAKAIAGQHDQALETLRQGIASHADNAVLYLNLGVAQSKSGRHQNAVETFERMLNLKFGDEFLVHNALVREYETLGNAERSRQHRVSYLETISAALKAALN
jgi:tetratricopeptide (TPR) repeat protein